MKKIRRIFREKGMKGIYQKMKRKIYRKSFEYSISLEDLKLEEKSSQFILREINQRIFDGMILAYTDEITMRKRRLIEERLTSESTDRCYVVEDDKNEIYGYYHIAFGENYDAGIHANIVDHPDNIYLFDDYTFSRKRGLGAHRFSIRERLRLAAADDYKTATVHIEDLNEVSRRSYESIGYQIVKVYRFYRLVNKTTVEKL